MNYINERGLQDYVSNVANQKVKDILQNMLTVKLKGLPRKTIDDQKYYLTTEVDNLINSFVDNISTIIVQDLNTNQVNFNKLSFVLIGNRDKYYRDESINKFVDNLISKYNFLISMFYKTL